MYVHVYSIDMYMASCQNDSFVLFFSKYMITKYTKFVSLFLGCILAFITSPWNVSFCVWSNHFWWNMYIYIHHIWMAFLQNVFLKCVWLNHFFECMNMYIHYIYVVSLQSVFLCVWLNHIFECTNIYKCRTFTVSLQNVFLYV